MNKQGKNLQKAHVEEIEIKKSERWTIFLYSANIVISLGFSITFFLNFLLLKSNYYKFGSIVYFVVCLGSLYYLHRYTNNISIGQNESSRSRITPIEPQV